MKKLLLGLVVAGALSTSAYAASCSASGTFGGRTSGDGFVADAQSAAGVTTGQTSSVVAGQVSANIGNGSATVDGLASGAALRLNTTDAMAAVAANGYNCGWMVWANPFGYWANLDKKGNDVGYDLDVYGINVGVTKYFTNFKVGLSGGYAYGDTDIKGSYGSYNTDNWNLSAYGSFYMNNFFVDALIGYMWTDYDSYKAVGINTATASASSFDGDSWFTHLKVGYNFEFCSWIITPSVAWDYVHTDVDGFTLKDKNPLPGAIVDRKVSSSSTYSSRLPIMLRVAKNFGTNQLYIQGGYIREFNDYGANGSVFDPAGGKYWVKGQKNNQNYGTVGAGWMGSYNRFNYGLTYDYEWASGYDSHLANIYLGIKF